MVFVFLVRVILTSRFQCDASESTSCTECTNRKVRCQFTKETNRRMSSIKFVPPRAFCSVLVGERNHPF